MDLNGDGQPDIVEAHEFSGIGVWLNQGGNYVLQGTYSVGYPLWIGARDLHITGRSDLILEGWPPYLMVNRGDGTFADPIRLFDNDAAMNPVVADFDGDGTPDLAALVPAGPFLSLDAGVLVYAGLLDGGLAVPVSYSVELSPLVGATARALLTADFRGNGSADLVAAGWKPDALVLLGYADGGFATPAPYSFSEAQAADARWLLVGDFNGDGRDDLAAVTIGLESAPEPTASLEVRLSNPDGTFQPFTSYSMTRDPDQVLATFTYRDLDGDGLAEMVGFFGAWQDDAKNALRVYWQLPDGGFSPPTQVHSENRGIYWEYADKINVEDLDGDGEPDLVFQGGPGFEIFLNACR